MQLVVKSSSHSAPVGTRILNGFQTRKSPVKRQQHDIPRLITVPTPYLWYWIFDFASKTDNAEVPLLSDQNNSVCVLLMIEVSFYFFIWRINSSEIDWISSTEKKCFSTRANFVLVHKALLPMDPSGYSCSRALDSCLSAPQGSSAGRTTVLANLLRLLT